MPLVYFNKIESKLYNHLNLSNIRNETLRKSLCICHHVATIFIARAGLAFLGA